jgi:hypothetical protein
MMHAPAGWGVAALVPSAGAAHRRASCRARSVSRPVLELVHRSEPVAGRVLGAGYIDVDGYVLAVTRPDGPRMPNGIEADLALSAGATACVGRGRLTVDFGAGELTVVSTGPPWEPVPRARCRLAVAPRFTLEPATLSGRGPGLTPYGDDLLVGYVAGLALWRGDHARAVAIARAIAPRTTALAATLLRHAARGELPEPAHALLECGDPGPLSAFGHSSGRAILLGLALASPATVRDRDEAGAQIAITPPPGVAHPCVTVHVAPGKP